MNSCKLESGGGQPLITIAIAIYNPELNWLKQQLCSLNEQSYGNLELIAIDDCSTKIEITELEKLIKECVDRFPVSVYQNTENIGSDKTFEKLTQCAKGKYIAYCDQDDIWNLDKLEKLQHFIEEHQVALVFSDVKIIDGQGNIVAESITKVRKRHVFYDGENCPRYLLYKNFVMGCTMLIRTEIAQQALPFIEGMVHDHFLALHTAVNGQIKFCNEALIQYRIHENNQTNVLTGVYTKEEYYTQRIKVFSQRIEKIKEKYQIDGIDEAYEWAILRKKYYNGDMRAAKRLWRLRTVNKSTTFFELLMLKMPDFIFTAVIEKIRKGKI